MVAGSWATTTNNGGDVGCLWWERTRAKYRESNVLEEPVAHQDAVDGLGKARGSRNQRGGRRLELGTEVPIAAHGTSSARANWGNRQSSLRRRHGAAEDGSDADRQQLVTLRGRRR